MPTGTLVVQTRAARGAVPVAGAQITVFCADNDQTPCASVRTDSSGSTAPIALSDFTGNWKDATGGTYELKLKDDGTCKMGEDDQMDSCTYTYDEKTYCLTIDNGNSKQVYTVGMFEGHLFLMLNGNNYTMYMYEKQ